MYITHIYIYNTYYVHVTYTHIWRGSDNASGENVNISGLAEGNMGVPCITVIFFCI